MATVGKPSAPEAWILFENSSRDDIVTLSLKQEGREVECAKVASGQLYVQRTFVGHRWVVRAPDGAVIMRCAGTAALQRFVVPAVAAWPGLAEEEEEEEEKEGSKHQNVILDILAKGKSVVSPGDQPGSDGLDTKGTGEAELRPPPDAATGVVNEMTETVTLKCQVSSADMEWQIKPGSSASLHIPPGVEVRAETEGHGYLCTLISGATDTSYLMAYDPEELTQQIEKLLPPNVHEYETFKISGFQVKLARNILHRQALLSALREDLREIRKVLPREALKVLSGTRLYFNASYRYGGQTARMMCTHWQEEWLEEHENLPEKAGHVECYRVEDYMCYRGTQPAVLLHEMAHCYHRRRFNDVDSAIQEAFRQAMADEKYSSVQHIHGKLQPHYAVTNHKEYFAECSEAFFSTGRFRNDFFPFIHEELKQFDPQGYAMVQEVWNPKGRCHDKSWERRYRKLGKAPRNYDPHTMALLPEGDLRRFLWCKMLLQGLRWLMRPFRQLKPGKLMGLPRKALPV